MPLAPSGAGDGEKADIYDPMAELKGIVSPGIGKDRERTQKSNFRGISDMLHIVILWASGIRRKRIAPSCVVLFGFAARLPGILIAIGRTDTNQNKERPTPVLPVEVAATMQRFPVPSWAVRLGCPPGHFATGGTVVPAVCRPCEARALDVAKPGRNPWL
eukprot:Skav229153  [mRNA]  locus=scaffold2275:208063:213590:+ [translate_table: standard]